MTSDQCRQAPQPPAAPPPRISYRNGSKNGPRCDGLRLTAHGSRLAACSPLTWILNPLTGPTPPPNNTQPPRVREEKALESAPVGPPLYTCSGAKGGRRTIRQFRPRCRRALPMGW
ncbi:hypothetical protein CGMCC3_g6840 [Colletotrichum fructicola]|nr:uncharacterized protein CGMCC3_g6840 [Colletotrichum fructicola]KAE9577006.1 hypothetical protein CGMCC3_g6840 [Colletotrichum fructicola]